MFIDKLTLYFRRTPTKAYEKLVFLHNLVLSKSLTLLTIGGQRELGGLLTTGISDEDLWLSVCTLRPFALFASPCFLINHCPLSNYTKQNGGFVSLSSHQVLSTHKRVRVQLKVMHQDHVPDCQYRMTIRAWSCTSRRGWLLHS